MKKRYGTPLKTALPGINIIPLVALIFIIHSFLPSPCFSDEETDLQITTLIHSVNNEDQRRGRDLLRQINEPSETIIQSLLVALNTPTLSKHFSKDYRKLIVKWGEPAIPYIVQTLYDNTNPKLAVDLIDEISQVHGKDAIIPAVPGLAYCIKEKKFKEKSKALRLLTQLKDLADQAVPDLTQEMENSRNTDIQWSITIAQALKEIAGHDYPPIQPFLQQNKVLLKQYVNTVDNDNFKLEIGFDISGLKFKEEEMVHELLVGPAQSFPYKKIKFKDITYDIAINKGKIEYISTTDSNFITNDGFKVGDTIESLKQMGYEEFKELRGWGYYIKLKSGWNAGFSILQDNTYKPLKNDSKIAWFFISR